MLPSLVATAQDGDITPDTLAWRDYFPLQLGNRWQYENVSEHDFGMSDRWIEDWYLSGDTVIAAATYFVMSVRCDSLYSNPGFGTNPCVRHDGNRRLVRYDTTSNNVAERVVDRNGGFVESGFFGYNFDLAGDFGFSNEMFEMIVFGRC